MIDMGMCDVSGCGKPAVVAYSLNLNLNGPSSMPSVMGPMQRRCHDHNEGWFRQVHDPSDVAEIEHLRTELADMTEQMKAWFDLHQKATAREDAMREVVAAVAKAPVTSAVATMRTPTVVVSIFVQEQARALLAEGEATR